MTLWFDYAQNGSVFYSLDGVVYIQFCQNTLAVCVDRMNAQAEHVRNFFGEKSLRDFFQYFDFTGGQNGIAVIQVIERSECISGFCINQL